MVRLNYAYLSEGTSKISYFTVAFTVYTSIDFNHSYYTAALP